MTRGSRRLAIWCRSSILTTSCSFMAGLPRSACVPPHAADPSPGVRRGQGAALLSIMSRRTLGGIDDRAQHDAALLRPIIAGAAMHRRPLVPYDQIADPPGMVIDKAFLRRVRGELLDQPPRFLALHADKTVRVHRI